MRRNNRKGYLTRGLLLCLPLLTVFIITAIADLASAQSTAPIRIGYISSFTGPLVRTGAHCRAGLLMAVKEANETGGVLGRQIEVIIRDDKLKNEQALRDANELIYNEKCVALVGVQSSGIAVNVSDWAKEHKVLFFGYDCRTQTLTEELGHKYFFRSSSNTVMDGRNMAGVMAKKPWKRWALIGGDYEYGHKQCESFKVLLKKRRPDTEFVCEQWPKFGETEYTPYITALIASKPEAIYGALPGSDGVSFAKQAKGFGLFEKSAYVSAHTGELTFLEPMGLDGVEGLIMGSNYFHLYKPEIPENKKFVDRILKEANEYPSNYTFLGYMGMKFVIEGIRKAGSTDTEAMIKALEGISVVSPLGEKVTIRPYDHQSDMGLLYGITAKDPRYPKHFVLKDIQYSPGGPFMTPIEEIKAIRAANIKK